MPDFIEYTDLITGQKSFVRKNVVAAIVASAKGGAQIVIAPGITDERREWGNLHATEDPATIHSRVAS